MTHNDIMVVHMYIENDALRQVLLYVLSKPERYVGDMEFECCCYMYMLFMCMYVVKSFVHFIL